MKSNDQPPPLDNSSLSKFVLGRGLVQSPSRFGDEIWDFGNFIPNPNRSVAHSSIKFAIPLPDGTRLDNVKHAPLLKGVKQFVFARWNARTFKAGGSLKATSLIDQFDHLRVLVQWMVQENLSNFDQLNSTACARYVDWCRKQKRKNHNGRELPRFGSERLTSMFRVVEYLHMYGAYLSVRMPGPPWPDFKISELSGHTQNAHAAARTEKIPDRLASKLAQHAILFVEQKAQAIVVLKEQLETRKVLQASIEEELIEQPNENLIGREPPADKSISAQIRAAKRLAWSENVTLRANGFKNKRDFNQQLNHLRTACYVIIGLFSGVRSSENYSLEAGAFFSREELGGESFSWIRGTTYKFERLPTSAEWMVPPIVGVAVNVAEKLSSRSRLLLEQHSKVIRRAIDGLAAGQDSKDLRKRLAHAEKYKRSLWVTCVSASAFNGPLLEFHQSISLKSFAENAGLIVESVDLPEIRDRLSIPVGTVWPLKPHQFRRTFALFVAHNRMGDMRYLRHHFKHMHIDMTLAYGKNDLVDETLLSEIENERQGLQQQLLMDWIFGDDVLAGNGGKRILEARPHYLVNTFKNKSRFVQQIGEGMAIRGTGHSWCLAQGAGCGGQGLYEMTRCAGCGDAVIDQSHREVWMALRKQQLEVLDWPDLGEPMRERCRQQLQRIDMVLSSLSAFKREVEHADV